MAKITLWKKQEHILQKRRKWIVNMKLQLNYKNVLRFIDYLLLPFPRLDWFYLRFKSRVRHGALERRIRSGWLNQTIPVDRDKPWGQYVCHLSFVAFPLYRDTYTPTLHKSCSFFFCLILILSENPDISTNVGGRQRIWRLKDDLFSQ